VLRGSSVLRGRSVLGAILSPSALLLSLPEERGERGGWREGVNCSGCGRGREGKDKGGGRGIAPPVCMDYPCIAAVFVLFLSSILSSQVSLSSLARVRYLFLDASSRAANRAFEVEFHGMSRSAAKS